MNEHTIDPSRDPSGSGAEQSLQSAPVYAHNASIHNASINGSNGSTGSVGEPVRPKLLYPSLVIAAIAVTLFSLLGIATMTGILPQAHSAANSAMNNAAGSSQQIADPELASVPAPAASSAAPAMLESLPRGNAQEVAVNDAQRDAQRNEPNAVAAVCHTCGTVESINQIESKGQGSGIGAVAGGIAGALLGNTMGAGHGRTALTLLGAGGGAYAGNEIEKNTHKTTSYRIRVRLENGELRTVYQRTPPAVAVGDHVKVANGEIVRQS